jgi:carbon monoxide dehydrogenase subunit G
MSQLLRLVTRDVSLKVLALFIAGFFWVIAVLDRTYDVRVVVPITAARSNTKQVIPDIDVKSTVVTLEGKGRDLLGVKSQQLAFRLQIPDGKVGTRQLQLSPAALKLPPDVRVRTLDPNNVELKLSAAASRMVQVQVATKGQPASGVALSVNEPPAQVRLSGTEEDLKVASAVTTETLDLATVTEPGRRRLKVVPPEAGRYAVQPESVDVVIGLEKEGARIFLGLPVAPVGADAQRVEIDPTEAQIAVAGPGSRIASLKQSDIAAQVRVSGLAPGEYQLAAEITLPPGFHLVKCEPQLFDVIVK